MRLYYAGICMSLCLVLLAFASPALASGTPFSISGQVIDAYGNPVPGASVTLIDNTYKALAIKTTSENGQYDFVNVVSNTSTVLVQVNLTINGTTYTVPSYYTKWRTAQGIQCIPSSETQFPDYPAPDYGYVYGAIQTDTSLNPMFIDGIVYLASPNGSVKYYELADATNGKGSFSFYVPPGTYMLYAQHYENGIAYESTHNKVTVGRNIEMTDPGLTSTAIVLPLTAPAASPDPAVMPVHHDNTVSGTVTTKDGKPVAGATVTLYQLSDNASCFLSLMGSGSKPMTAVTDSSGHYRLSGVLPTTDGGKPIQWEKDIKAMVEYADLGGMPQAAYSGPAPLYYPDLIAGDGSEGAARNVTLSVTVPITEEAGPQATVSVSDVPTPSRSSSVMVVPLLAALAIGAACIASVYVLMNRKG